MALIKCPECGQEVSDRASQCPKCAFPIAEMKTDGIVRVKINPLYGKQSVSIYDKAGNPLWDGKTGEIAEIKLSKPTNVLVKYHFGMYNGAKCEGTIDPSKGKKYVVQGVEGFFKMQCVLQRVDHIDSE